ncbi:GNAT family N-acetyltransferase [Jatrophihabitans sp.]|uniref:GNAT family N-acetyltransferase n=1 Tax=Jatrophihabitans sp. TaxID=1932789 RepID=UPI002D037191|nr:GNAT family N-acetyltransferase [Jatrophihabitans sp.]
MRVLSFPQHAVPSALRAQVEALQDQAWPRSAGEPPTGHDPALRPVTMLLVDDRDVVLSSLAILSKEISHAGRRFAASGLSAVVTDSSQRGRGHGHRLVSAAREQIAAGGADLGIFSCDRALAGFYQRAGWRVLPGTVLIGGTPHDPFPSDRFDKVVLAELFTEHAREHAVSFTHARIELYPGEIDKLW